MLLMPLNLILSCGNYFVVSGGINPIFDNCFKTELIVAYVYSINVSQGKLIPIPKNVIEVAEYP